MRHSRVRTLTAVLAAIPVWTSTFAPIGSGLEATAAFPASPSRGVEAREGLERALDRELRQSLASWLDAWPSVDDAGLEAMAARLEEEPLEDVLASLRRGPLRSDPVRSARGGAEREGLEAFGTVLSGLTFDVAGERFSYAVDIPRGYDPDAPTGLLIDPGHGSARGSSAEAKAGMLEMYRRLADESGGKRFLIARTEIVETLGTGGTRPVPEEEVLPVFDAFLRDVTRRFAVDLDRVFVSGISQTGFWSWYLGHASAWRLAGIAPAGAVTWQSEPYLENLAFLPTFVVHGAEDPKCAVSGPRSACARLERLGAPVRYLELAGEGHDYGVWQHLSDAYAWLFERERRRDPFPSSVSKSVQTLSDPFAGWIELLALEETGNGEAGTAPTAGVDAVIDGQLVSVFSEGVERLRLDLAPELLDLERPVRVVWNGKELHAGRLDVDLEGLLRRVVRRGDWRLLAPVGIELRAPRD